MFGFGGFGGGRNLGGSGEKSKAEKRKRAASREQTKRGSGKDLVCEEELVKQYTLGKLHDFLDKSCANVGELKELAARNSIPRSGARYEVTQAIIAHVQGYVAQQAKAGLATKAASGDAASATELSFASVKSLDGALKHAQKLVGKMTGPFPAQLEALRGITAGLTNEIHVAVTGPNRAKYNGKYGETAQECNDWLAGEWVMFLKSRLPAISDEELALFADAAAVKNEAEDYGYDRPLLHSGEVMAALLPESKKEAFNARIKACK